MVNILSLPKELFSRIFEHIDSNVQLAQCRLVCSEWNSPANTAMFSNTIVFKTKSKALALYAQLFIDPSKGKLIRHIYFDKDFDCFWMVKAIFDVAHSLNLESLKGESLTTECCTTLLDIIKASPTAFNKVKVMPRYKDAINKAFSDVLRACRYTLSEIDIDNKKIYLNNTIKEFAPTFNTFDNLKTLNYSGSFKQISEIELLLKGCIHLEKMTLGNLIDGEAMEKQNLKVWMETEVNQVESLKGLTINHQCRCDVMEYLTYKYPNLKNINILVNHFDLMYADNMAEFKGNMDRILQSIESIPSKVMTFWLPLNQNLYQIIDYFIKKGYHFNIKNTQECNYLYVKIEGL
ncbi:hypothetical protein HMPREF1544_08926 [Mucor circinelloides 1006PhL]|uniref:F-box domain-containing protein n=1 Tax=Mucor circinelloides f. circinelloides (strain 1006PhL) TaxID=1220926 RepID=S2J2R3_MUCC1|nr:hypothetical protein HMPREF1544_08926 [Mucor circinelloides 1006PhL]